METALHTGTPTREVEDWDLAIQVLLHPDAIREVPIYPSALGYLSEPNIVGQQWRVRAAHHLVRRLNALLRDGLPVSMPDTEQAALALVKAVGDDLRQAGLALHSAAERLHRQGDSYGARLSREAGTKAKDAAKGLLGS